ncbi:hypothetical protein HK100_002819 [Physocladia obscura]|uniref:Uncharacterized protein n=1 Tax=Physocladia obscura TaxID=109957 RepID=A0AAD5XLB9_9FUNG|nr:hypothetical protein HK100_002819 [Physocladia obscura]
MMTTNPEQRVVNSQPKSVSPSQPYASVVASQSMQPTENLLPNDLHAEISTLKSARQTDAYLLSLKEREITELRNLLQAKTQTHEPSLLSPQSATSTTNANAIDVYLQTSNNDSTDTLVFSEGEPIHITDVTKLCDSPSISNPKCTPESQLLFGIKKQPSTVYDGTTKRVGGIQFGSLNMKSPNTLPPPPCALENLETQFSQSKFTDEQAFSDRDLASFKSLSLHAPTFAGPSSILSSSPATEFSPTEFCVGSLEKTSPPSVEQKLLDARGCSFDDETQNALYNSAIDISQMGSNIWGKYPSYSLAASFKSKEQSGLKFRQRSLNRDLMADDSRPISRVFDFENSNRFKNSKFNLDPNSPAYFPISSATQFRQQARLHSVPTYSDNKSAWNQTRHFSQTNTAYPEFDDIATENVKISPIFMQQIAYYDYF